MGANAGKFLLTRKSALLADMLNDASDRQFACEDDRRTKDAIAKSRRRQKWCHGLPRDRLFGLIYTRSCDHKKKTVRTYGVMNHEWSIVGGGPSMKHPRFVCLFKLLITSTIHQPRSRLARTSRGSLRRRAVRRRRGTCEIRDASASVVCLSCIVCRHARRAPKDDDACNPRRVSRECRGICRRSGVCREA